MLCSSVRCVNEAILVTKMIGAMPAVAVRHERRRGKRQRNSEAALYGGRERGPRHFHHRVYDCITEVGLYVVVGCVLLGGMLLIVGVVQLAPGAEAAKHRFFFLGTGGGLLAFGICTGLLRCLCLNCFDRFYEAADEPRETRHKNGLSAAEAGQGHHKAEEKPKIRGQSSVGKNMDGLVKQTSTNSEV